MKQILLLTILTLIFCLQGFGQENLSCPTIKIISPSKNTWAGDPIFFSVSIIGKFDNSKLEYKWKLSNGMIFGGQGTPAILGRTAKGIEGEVTATIEINGLPDGCQNTNSVTYMITPLPIHEPLDTYIGKSWLDEKIELQSLIITLKQNPPQTKALFVFSIKNESEINLVLSRQKKILQFLERNKISASQILMKIERTGYYETTIWIIPEGARIP